MHVVAARALFPGLLTLAALSAVAAAEQPLHEEIDKLIAAQADGPAGPVASDGAFLRRVYLDLAGRIPTSEEARAFLDDSSADKREKVIDRLLSSDDYALHMAEVFDVMLMERRGGHEEWTKFLESSFAANKPWDQMVREILAPDKDDEQTRGAAAFYVKRLERYGQQPNDMPGLVRDVGRMFLGVDVQCAQCHDHLFVDEYKQEFYQGLFAFVGNATLRRDSEFPAISEKPLMKKVEFTSVFVQIPKETGPRLPGGEEVEIPEFEKGEQYAVPPDRKTKEPGVPKFSTLEVLAEQLPSSENTLFRRNLANRLWWLMMGRGLVEPLDLHHADNPPSHPELLELLADSVTEHKFDIKWMLRELALSETYQRSSLLPQTDAKPSVSGYRVALEKRVSPEQLLRSVLVATGELTRVESKQEGAPTYDELTERFKNALANPPKEPEIEIAPSVQGALFLSNDEVVLSFLEKRKGNLINRLSKLDEPDAVAEELYLSVLTRRPVAEEREEARDYLEENADRRDVALGHLAWALLTSTEFCVNH